MQKRWERGKSRRAEGIGSASSFAVGLPESLIFFSALLLWSCLDSLWSWTGSGLTQEEFDG